MTWKTILQLLYVGLMAFGVWLSRANAETKIPEALDPRHEMAVIAADPNAAVTVAQHTIAQHVVAKDGESTLAAEHEDMTEAIEEKVIVDRAPASEEACAKTYVNSKIFNGTQFMTGSGDCMVSISETNDYPKRTLTFRGKGKIHIQVQFVGALKADGKTLQKDPLGGSRTYYVVPVSNVLEINTKNPTDPDIEVKTSPEMIWSFGKEEHTIRLPSECTGAIEDVTKTNKGGVQIQKCQNRLVIDMNWGVGESPEFFSPKKGDFINSEGTATIRDPNGKSCNVGYREILTYYTKEPNLGDSDLKFHSPSEWHQFLSHHASCKILSLGFLKSPEIMSTLVAPPELEVEKTPVVVDEPAKPEINDIPVDIQPLEYPAKRTRSTK